MIPSPPDSVMLTLCNKDLNITQCFAYGPHNQGHTPFDVKKQELSMLGSPSMNSGYGLGMCLLLGMCLVSKAHLHY